MMSWHTTESQYCMRTRRWRRETAGVWHVAKTSNSDAAGEEGMMGSHLGERLKMMYGDNIIEDVTGNRRFRNTALDDAELAAEARHIGRIGDSIRQKSYEIAHRRTALE